MFFVSLCVFYYIFSILWAHQDESCLHLLYIPDFIVISNFVNFSFILNFNILKKLIPPNNCTSNFIGFDWELRFKFRCYSTLSFNIRFILILEVVVKCAKHANSLPRWSLRAHALFANDLITVLLITFKNLLISVHLGTFSVDPANYSIVLIILWLQRWLINSHNISLL